jgi:hypothetical protein
VRFSHRYRRPAAVLAAARLTARPRAVLALLAVPAAVLVAVLLGAASARSAAGEPDPGRPGWFRVQLDVLRDDLPPLAAAGFDIAGIDRDARTVDVLATAGDLPRLEEFGKVAVVQWFDGPGAEVESAYLDETEIAALMDSLAATHPSIARIVDLGVTENGRAYRAMKISDNVMVEEDEPAVFFDFGHHAREVMVGEIAADLMDYLLVRYGIDPQVTAWVDATEIWVIPNHNPDGLAHVFDFDQDWRKNRRANGDGTFGVDLNRNYPLLWGTCNGSSGSTGSEIYRGPASESEPETRALADLAREQRPVFDLTYHSFGELVLYPYGCNGVIPPDQEASEDVGQRLGRQLLRDSTGSGTYLPGYSWAVLSVVDGESKSWFYGEAGALSYTIEVNASSSGGFRPNYVTWRTSTVQRNRAGWQYILERLDGPSVRGHVTDACTGAPIPAVVGIDEIPLTARETPRTAEPLHGRYQRVLLLGDYHLRAAHPGYHTQVHQVAVRTAAADRDVALVPLGSRGLAATTIVVDDALTGDGDGRLDPGETARLRVTARATGEAVTGITAQIATTDPYLSIADSQATYPDLAAGAEAPPSDDGFGVSADPATPVDQRAEILVFFQAAEPLCAPLQSLDLTITARRPACPAFLEPFDANPGWPFANSVPDGWEFGPPVALPSGQGPAAAATGANVFGTNLDGLYPNSATFTLLTTPYDLTGLTGTVLKMQRWLSSEQGFDYATVEASADGGATWSLLWTGTARDRAWRPVALDASAVDGAPAARFRFRFVSDALDADAGWYLDDVAVCGEIAPALTPASLAVIDDTANPACTDGDATADAGEGVTLRLIAENRGVAPALGATVDLASGDPAVELLTGQQQLGDVPAGGQAQADFLARIDSAAACGQIVPMAATFASNGLPFAGAPLSLTLEMDGAACDANPCPAACAPTAEVEGLAVAQDGRVSWTPSADPCHALAGIAYRVYRAGTPVPVVIPPSAFPQDTEFTEISLADADGSLLDPGLDDPSLPASGAAFYYLAADVGTNGALGPLGHYGN